MVRKLDWEIVLITAMAVAAFLLVMIPAVHAAPLPQVNTVLAYSKVLDGATIASELGLPAQAVVNYSETLAGCTVTLAPVLRVDTDEVYNGQGQVVSSQQRNVTALTASQMDRLDELMRSRGCYRTLQ